MKKKRLNINIAICWIGFWCGCLVFDMIDLVHKIANHDNIVSTIVWIIVNILFILFNFHIVNLILTDFQNKDKEDEE